MRYPTGKKRLGALVLAAVTAAACVLPAGAVGNGVTPIYDEAYYATLDYYGNLLEGSVVKSYALNGFDTLTDYGVYDRVINLTDGTPAVTGGGSASFRFPGGGPERFYFEGKTARPFAELPWTVTLRYTLNGVPARAEELAGQRGVVEILLDIVPNPSASDYARYNYTLEAAALFNQDDILSLEAPGAQVQLVGNLRTVLFLALPGEERHFTIRVGSDDFSFGGMTVLMVPATLAQLEEIAKLSQRKDDLEEDYRALSGSLDSLLDALAAMESGLSASASGLDRLDLARQTFSGGKDTLYGGTDALRGDLTSLADLLEPVEQQVQVLSRTVTDSFALLNQLTDAAVSLRRELGDLEDALEGLENGTGDLRSLLRCAGSLQSSLRRLQSALGGVPAPIPPGGDDGDQDFSASGLVEQVKSAHRAYEAIQSGSRASAFAALLVLQGESSAAAREKAAQADLLADAPSADAAAAAMCEQVRQKVLAAAGVDEETFNSDRLPAEQKAAIQAQIDAAQAKAEAEVRSLFPEVQKLNALYQMSRGSTFQQFCGMLPGVTKAQAKQMNDLWIIYSSGSLLTNAPGGAEEDTLSASLLHWEPGSEAGGDSGSSGSDTGSTGGDSGSSGDGSGSTGGDSGSSGSGSGSTGGDSGSTGGDTGSTGGDSGSTGGDSGSTGDGSGSTGGDTGSTGGDTGSTGEDSGDPDGGPDDSGDPGDSGEETPPPSESVGGAVVDLITGGLDSAGKELKRLEGELSEMIQRVAGPTAAVTGDLAALCGRLEDLTGLLNDAEDLTAALRRSSGEIRSILDAVDSLRNLLNAYEPTLQESLQTAGSLSACAVTAVRDTESLLGNAENLLRDTGVHLDAGTRQTLHGLADSLRQAAGAMAATGDVRAAKSTITGIIEDTWNEYTGDVNNILMMDAGADPVSLTDPRNPAPSSIQVLIRTQEIKEAEPETDAEEAAAREQTTFWGRIARMFRDFWSAVTGVFH